MTYQGHEEYKLRTARVVRDYSHVVIGIGPGRMVSVLFRDHGMDLRDLLPDHGHP